MKSPDTTANIMPTIWIALVCQRGNAVVGVAGLIERSADLSHRHFGSRASFAIA